MMAPFDAIVIGAGPAGCSTASWAAQLGLAVAVVERAPGPCASLNGLDFPQDWVLGHRATPLATLARGYATHVMGLPGLRWQFSATVRALARQHDGWQVVLADGSVLDARALVLATGLRPRRPAAYFGGDTPVLDAPALTLRRAELQPGRTLLLGGGDNALENAAWLAARGHRVTVWTRGDWRGRAALREAAQRLDAITLRVATPPPAALRARADGGIDAESTAFGVERFDHAAVLYGYEPEPAPWSWLRDALHDRVSAERVKPGAPIEGLGVFVAGDASGRAHPCVQTALADGVFAAQQLLLYLGRNGASAPAIAQPEPSTLDHQVLQLRGLRFGARLGVLPHERDAPQPIEVDAELNLGRQLALGDQADLHHVLDYRKVRRLIIEECNAEHTDLLESLLAKLCRRLMQLRGVLGVRIRVAKLAIFDDCEVAIRCEAGLW